MINQPAGHAGTEDNRAIHIAFLAALEAGEPPDTWFRRYPQHAPLLIDLAQAYGVEAAQPAPLPADIVAVTAIGRRTLAQATAPATLGLAARAARAGLSLRELAARVSLSSDILLKVDRCIIQPATVPARLVEQLAQLLGCTTDALRAGLAGTAPRTAGAMYHAAQAPQVGQQTFAEAVRSSRMISAADRKRWLAE